jgi:hypothetical protein
LSVSIVAKWIVHASYAGRKRSREVGSDNITREAAGRRGVRVGLAEIEARVPAQLVSELADALISQTKIERQSFANSVVILCECGTLPRPISSICQPEVIKRRKNIAEFRTIALRI